MATDGRDPASRRDTMDSRTRVLVAAVAALAIADGWPVDSGWSALVLVIVTLTPVLAWARTAPTPAWSWSVSALMLGGCSRSSGCPGRR